MNSRPLPVPTQMPTTMSLFAPRAGTLSRRVPAGMTGPLAPPLSADSRPASSVALSSVPVVAANSCISGNACGSMPVSGSAEARLDPANAVTVELTTG